MTTEKNIIEYIRGIPKVELHLHIEGSFEPELVFKIAQRNQLSVKIEKPAPQNDAEIETIKKLSQKALDIGAEWIQGDDGSIKVMFESAEQLSQAYHFDNLQEFLDIYYAGMNVLQSEQDFYDLTMAYLEKCHTQNILHTEIFFDPQGHTCRGIRFETVINGISRALDDGEKKFGISSGLIMSYLRHLSEEDAINTWQAAQPHLDKFIAVGLDSAELGHPPSKFKNVFAMARAANKKVVCHAGEEGPPEYIWQALDLLEVDRVDHGNRSLEDDALVSRLVSDEMTLTVCPLSNNKLQVVTEMSAHPLKTMLNHGLKVTVHSDDPAYFGGYINENFAAVQQALGLSRDDIYRLVLNAIDGSFMPEKQKPSLRAKVDAYHKAVLENEKC
ncbi:Adenosine deaminase [hydrothermal vent metagenome]|uniref:Adenosine deaminase n=1 Tax=hydrothermal vent metagenome TaxID=652676 RepID=A0A3B0Z5J8_9ZZZZ